MRELFSEADWQYLAGSLEARSCIWVSRIQRRYQTRAGGKTYTSSSTYLTVTRDKRELLEILQPFFPQPIHDNYLQIQGKQALPILEGIYPFTRILKPLVGGAISFENRKQELKESGKEVSDLCEQYYQEMQQCKRYLNVFYIGKEPLSLAYLAGFWDQNRIYTEILGSGSPLCQIRQGSISFLDLLKDQFGGHLYPKGEPPESWRVTGEQARSFLETFSPLTKRRHQRLAELGIQLED